MSTRAKTVLITGSTDGVGRYIAERLAGEGWSVIVHGRDRTRGEALVKRIAHQGGAARFIAADLSSLAEVRSLADAVQRDGDGLDALVNNAGIGTSGARRELSADGFELRFAVNYLAGDAALAAYAGESPIVAHRQRFFRGPTGNRLFRCDAHARL
jgi:NAD(P)-dependent dehydrogenase (short-subunit alcohol dehydrogenase family)